MTILDVLKQLRDDLKLWCTNNFNYKLNKNLGEEESSKLLSVDTNGDIVTIDNTLSGVTSNVQTQLDNKASSNHIHTGYLTEAQVQTMLDAFAERYGLTSSGSGSGSGGTTTTVKFTVNSTAYTVDNDTTWSDWVSAMGAASGFVISGTKVYAPDGTIICSSYTTSSNYTAVTASANIVAGDYYSLAVYQGNTGGGGNSGDSGSDIIYFTVKDTHYSVTRGTTWQTFAENSNGTFIYQADEDLVFESVNMRTVMYNGNAVSGSDTIISGGVYVCT